MFHFSDSLLCCHENLSAARSTPAAATATNKSSIKIKLDHNLHTVSTVTQVTTFSLPVSIWKNLENNTDGGTLS